MCIGEREDMGKCKYREENGVCEKLSDNEVKQPCVKGPCEFDTTVASELKNCPFCGGVAKIQKDIRFPKNMSKGITAYEPVCTNHKCPIYMSDGKYYRTKSEAISAWNTRTTSPRFTEGEREAMEALVSLSEYSEIHLSKLLNNGRKSAIATVRQMLEEDK